MAIRECDCKEFQDSGHTDECNKHYNPKKTMTPKSKLVAELDELLETGAGKSDYAKGINTGIGLAKRAAIAHESAQQALIEQLRMEAQAHAHEARTANATLAEIYQIISGAKGEKASWNGAAPVREYIAAQQDTLRQVRDLLEKMSAGTAPRDYTFAELQDIARQALALLKQMLEG